MSPSNIMLPVVDEQHACGTVSQQEVPHCAFKARSFERSLFHLSSLHSSRPTYFYQSSQLWHTTLPIRHLYLQAILPAWLILLRVQASKQIRFFMVETPFRVPMCRLAWCNGVPIPAAITMAGIRTLIVSSTASV